MSEEENFELADFLQENSALFTVLAAFGALSIYFSQLPVSINSQVRNLGVASSLFLFVGIALTIRRNLKQSLEGELFDFLIKPRLKSYRLVFFVVPFYVLIISIISAVAQFSEATGVLLQLIVIIIGVSNVLWFVTKILESVNYNDSFGELGRDPKIPQFAKWVIVIGIFAVGIGTIGLIHLSLTYGYGIGDAVGSQIDRGLVPFLFAYFTGICIGGGIYSVVGVLLIGSHILVAKMIESGKLEEYAEFYKTWRGENDAGQSALDDF